MSRYTPEIQAAYDAIRDAGQTVTIHRLGFAAAYDPVSPTTAVKLITASTTGKAVVLPASKGTIEAFDNRLGTDPNRRQSFRFLLVAAKGLTFEPLAEDVIVTAQGPWRILGATPLNPDGKSAIIYSVGCSTDVEAFEEPTSEAVPLYCNNTGLFCNNTSIYCNATTYTP